MSTRAGVGDQAANVTGLVAVCHSVTFGASSAVDSQAANTGANFIVSGAGLWAVQLVELWSDFIVVDATQVGGTPGGGTWEITTDLSPSGTGTVLGIEYLMQDGTPSRNDPPQEKFQFIFWMRGSVGGPAL